jgi:hypothetical protein
MDSSVISLMEHDIEMQIYVYPVSFNAMIKLYAMCEDERLVIQKALPMLVNYVLFQTVHFCARTSRTRVYILTHTFQFHRVICFRFKIDVVNRAPAGSRRSSKGPISQKLCSIWASGGPRSLTRKETRPF